MKKAERRRIDAFELWCWRRLLSRVKSHLCYNLDSASSILPFLEENMPLGFHGSQDTATRKVLELLVLHVNADGRRPGTGRQEAGHGPSQMAGGSLTNTVYAFGF